MLGASVAMMLAVVAVGVRTSVVVVVRVPLHPAFLLAGGANADGDRREAAQRNQREHRADKEQLQGAFHGAGC